MAFDKKLAARVRERLGRRKGISEKVMFGGIGFLLNCHIAVGVWKDSLIVRVGDAEYDAARQAPYVREFDITGRPMTGWILVEPQAIEDDLQLDGWIKLAVKFVKTLPPKHLT